MLSRECAWDVVQEDHQIDHWSIVVADVKQHARKRTIWVVRVHTLRYNCESNLNMHCAHRRDSLFDIDLCNGSAQKCVVYVSVKHTRRW